MMKSRWGEDRALWLRAKDSYLIRGSNPSIFHNLKQLERQLSKKFNDTPLTPQLFNSRNNKVGLWSMVSNAFEMSRKIPSTDCFFFFESTYNITDVISKVVTWLVEWLRLNPNC